MFDVVGTLVEPWPTVPVAYQRAARRQGIECPAEDLRGRFAAAWQRQEAIDAAATPPYATSRTREVQRWRGIVHEVFAAEAQEAVEAEKRAARKERKALTKEEQKAARDARYAARKARTR